MNVYLIGLLLLLNCLLNAGGSIALKQAAISMNAGLAVFGVGCYVFAAAIAVALLNTQPLSVIGMVTSMAGLVIVITASIYVFEESLVFVQWIGVSCALVSMLLIYLPSLQG